MPLLANSEPFFFPGDSTGCLLIHGFTATPQVMRGLGEHLSHRGFSVLGVRLAGHATHPLDMARTRWRDWAVSVEEGWCLLKGVADRIFLIGHSTGGALALWFAADHPVTGVVGLSTIYRLPPMKPPRPLNLLPLPVRLKVFKVMSKFRPLSPKGPPFWYDQQAQQHYIAYPDNPVRSVLELRLLLLNMRASLDQVRVPVLVIHSKNDPFISYKDSESIYHSLGTADKEVLLVEKSGHILPMDAERERVFAATTDFIQRVLAKTAPHEP